MEPHIHQGQEGGKKTREEENTHEHCLIASKEGGEKT